MRLLLIYTVLGPLIGALLYVALSAMAGALGLRTSLFMDSALFSWALAQSAGVAGWQIAISAPLSLAPALVTGLATWRRIARWGSCPWWLSCLYGALASGPPGALFLWAAHAAYPDLIIVPHPSLGGMLIAVIGFLGTWPCWRLAAFQPSNVKLHPTSSGQH